MFKPRPANVRPAVQTGTTKYRSLLVVERLAGSTDDEPSVVAHGELKTRTGPAPAPKKPHRDAN